MKTRSFFSRLLLGALIVLGGFLCSPLVAQVVDLDEEWRVQFHTLAHELKGQKGDRPYDDQSAIQDSDKTPTDIVLRRTKAMLDDYQNRFPGIALDLDACRAELAELEKAAAALEPVKGKVPSLNFGSVGRDKRPDHEPPNKAGAVDLGEHQKIFTAACELNRKVALANPLFNFDRLVFVKKHPTRVGHMCDQWFGMAQDPGGGLFVLKNPGKPEARITNLTEGAQAAGQGIMAGKTLHEGVFASPEVSYDGQTIWFAYSALTEAFSDRWEAEAQKADNDPKYKIAPWGGEWWNEGGKAPNVEYKH